MRGFASFMIMGVSAIVAFNVMVPPVGFGLLPVGAATSTGGDKALQSVDRTNKGDRIAVTSVGKRESEQQPAQKMPAGCDPAFSPLLVQARANFARSCSV